MNKFKWGKATSVALLLLALSACLNAATGEKIKSALESARKDLYISMATEKKIAAEIAKLKKSGNVSFDVIKDYEYYLSRQQALVAEKRRVVEKMEALYEKYEMKQEHGGSAGSNGKTPMTNLDVPEEKVVDKVAVLDRELNNSLAEFDELLLEELDLARTKSSEKMKDLADEAEAAAKRLRDKGIDLDTGDKKGSVESDKKERAAESGKKEGTVKSENGSKEAHREVGEGKTGSQAGGKNQSEKGRNGATISGNSGYGGKSRGDGEHPGSQYAPEDDDIVAKQLRQAAEEETDPELKKKLWKEYVKYRENSAN